MSFQGEHPQFLVVGEILRPHGVRGELRMRVLMEDPARLYELDELYLAKAPDDSAPSRHKLDGVRFNKAYALLNLEGSCNRDTAESQRGKLVMIRADQAAPLDDGQYFLYQLLGLMVVTEEREIGRVKEVLQTGANDVYVVDSDAFGEVLIPAHQETIVNIDFDAKSITMNLPEGLLPTS